MIKLILMKLMNMFLKKNVSLVNQDPFIFNDTILNNLKIVKPSATQEEIENACKLANIHNEILSF